MPAPAATSSSRCSATSSSSWAGPPVAERASTSPAPWHRGSPARASPRANVDPVERIRFEELVHVAELHVAELTGSSATPTGSSMEVAAVGPGRVGVADRRGLAVPPRRHVEPAPNGSGDGDRGGHPSRRRRPTGAPGRRRDNASAGSGPHRSRRDDVEPAPGSADVLGRWLATMGPILAAVQLASAVGHLARTTLGPYELPIPRPGHKPPRRAGQRGPLRRGLEPRRRRGPAVGVPARVSRRTPCCRSPTWPSACASCWCGWSRGWPRTRRARRPLQRSRPHPARRAATAAR